MRIIHKIGLLIFACGQLIAIDTKLLHKCNALAEKQYYADRKICAKDLKCHEKNNQTFKQKSAECKTRASKSLFLSGPGCQAHITKTLAKRMRNCSKLKSGYREACLKFIRTEYNLNTKICQSKKQVTAKELDHCLLLKKKLAICKATGKPLCTNAEGRNIHLTQLALLVSKFCPLY